MKPQTLSGLSILLLLLPMPASAQGKHFYSDWTASDWATLCHWANRADNAPMQRLALAEVIRRSEGISPSIWCNPKWAAEQVAAKKKAELEKVALAEAQSKRLIIEAALNEWRSLPWKERLDRFVQTELRKWLVPETSGFEEIPAPNFPAALSLKQESWETNKEFEDRVEKARTERRQSIDRIQAEYRNRVEKRNRLVLEYNKTRQEREVKLPERRRELVLSAIEVLNPSVQLTDAALDQQTGALTLSAQVEGLTKYTFAFTGTPQDFRRSALVELQSIKAKPEFQVSDNGEISLLALTVVSGGANARGVPSTSIATPIQLATVILPQVTAPGIEQQSAITVDRNQVEQILYRDENEMLRKRIEDQRRQQEQAVANEQAKAATEIARLRAEAEALRKQPPDSRPILSVATVREAHALVIGNSAYGGSSSLANAVNDATAMSTKLRSLGFKVTELVNASREALVKGMSQFRNTASQADLTLLFYAGHGVQISGSNYMIPVDMSLNDASLATLQAVSLNSVVEQYLPGKTKLVFLDACRDNPLMASVGRGISKGLAPINVSEGTLIAYATKDGQTADDGVGQKNSPFTTALLEHLSDPEDIAVVLRTVRAKVMQRTNNRQQPWEYGSLTGGALVLSAIQSSIPESASVASSFQNTPASTPAVSPPPIDTGGSRPSSTPSIFRSILDKIIKD